MNELPDLSQLSSEEKDQFIQKLWEENRFLKQGAVTHPLFAKRRAGVLLHPTSLPVTPGNGDLGDQAYYFVDFLKECGFSVWQMLPIHPPHRLPIGYPHRDFLSPYQCQCVHAGNPALINLEWLVRKGWLNELGEPPIVAEVPKEPTVAQVEDYRRQIEAVMDYRHQCLRKAYGDFSNPIAKVDRNAFLEFKEKNVFWLENYALFHAIKRDDSRPWWKWREKLRDYEPTAIAGARKRLEKRMDFYRFQQFVFFEQWRELREYAHSKDVYLFGDMPMFVSEDSVEMWAQRNNFLVNEQGRAQFVAGTPPHEKDFFRLQGQCWGNPLYNWKIMQANEFQWWFERFNTLGQMFDLVRLTHFRGFSKCWAIPAGANHQCDSQKGHWEDVPGIALFEKLTDWQTKGKMPLFTAENIAALSPEAEEANKLLEQCRFPQIKILQLAFDFDLSNTHLPHHHALSDVVYTGTQDSRTTLSWLNGFTKSERKERGDYMLRYLGVKLEVSFEELLWPLIKTAFSSKVKLAMIPMQDILELQGRQNRMNTPGKSKYNNWQWRFRWEQVRDEMKEKVKNLLQDYERN